jgi:hypothetical protein
LASPDRVVSKIKKYTISLLPLFLVLIWGVSFNALSVLAFRAGTDIAESLHTTPLIRLLISLGYQLGNLLLPPLVPIILWLYLFRDYAHKLVPKLVK